MPTDETPSMQRSHDSHSVTTHAPSVVQIDAGKLMLVLPWFVMALVISIVALISVGIVYKDLWDKFTMAENETKMLEMYVIESDARFVAHGYIKPEESYLSVRPKLFNQPEPKP